MTSASTSSEATEPRLTTPPLRPFISQSQHELDNLPERQPPLADKCYLHGEQPSPGQLWVIMGQTAFQQVSDHAHSNIHSELGGLLLGRVYRHQRTAFVEITAALPAINLDHGPIHFSFKADSWTQLNRDREAKYPQLEVVGWFHTHPGLGVFYSSDDVVVHTSSFTLAWQVGLVVDPIRQEASFFGHVDGRIAPLPGFYELLAEQPRSVIDWQAVQTVVWGQTAVDDPLPFVNTIRTKLNQPTYSVWPIWGVVTAGVIAILLLGLLTATIWSLRQQLVALQQVTTTLANVAGVNTAVCSDPHLRVLTPLTGSSYTVGEAIDFMGTTEIPDANQYRLEAHALNTEGWILVDTFRSDVALGKLATWDTTKYTPALYELRLTAVDRTNILLPNVAPCLIQIQLR